MKFCSTTAPSIQIVSMPVRTSPSAGEREPLRPDPPPDSDARGLRRSITKIDKHVLPFVFVAVFFVQGDKTFSNLLSSDLCERLDLDDKAYKAGDLLFLVGYLLFQVPSNLVLERTHPGRYLGGLLMAWGLIMVLSFLVKDALGLYISRFLLGAAEAGVVPGFWYYCTLFYPENALILPFSVVEVARFTSPILFIPLTDYIHQMDSSLPGWVWILIIDGCCGIVTGVLLVSIMPGSLSEAFFLNNKDARAIAARREAEGMLERSDSMTIVKKFVQEWRGALLSGGLWACAAVSHGSWMVAYLLQKWMPKIIAGRSREDHLVAVETATSCKDNGLHEDYGSGFTSAWLYGLLPIGVAFFAVFIVSVTSRLTRDRKYHAGWSLVITAVSLLCMPIMSALGSWPALYTFLVLALASVLVSGPPIVALASSFIGPEYKAVGLAGLNFVCRLGSYLGVLITNSLIADHGDYTVPLIFLGVLLLPCILIVFVLPDPNRMKKKPVLSTQLYMEDFEGLSTKVEPLDDVQPGRPFVPSVASVQQEVLEQPEVSVKDTATLEKVGSKRRVLYDFRAETEGELNVTVGDVVELLSAEKDGWVSVRRGDDEGLVPVGYIISE